MHRKSFHRFATSLVITVAFSLGSAIAAHATTEVIVKYTLGAGTQTGLIKVPANTPVQLIGDQTVTGDIGVAQLVLHNIPDEGLQWSGSSSADDAPLRGYSGASGTRIVSLDADGDVFLQVLFVLNKKGGGGNFGFIIVNSGSKTYTGQVKLIY